MNLKAPLLGRATAMEHYVPCILQRYIGTYNYTHLHANIFSFKSTGYPDE
jgi:hypothetical protein